MKSDRRLYVPIEEGDLEAVKELLAEGANFEVIDRAGCTAMMRAAVHEDIEIMKLLRAHGANINAQDRAYGYSALHYAAQEGNASAVRLLLKWGAEVDPQDKHGNTPLWVALMNARGKAHTEIRKALLPSRRKHSPEESTRA